MVNIKIINQYNRPPLPDTESRTIKDGPLYSAQQILALLEGDRDDNVHVWTKKCALDVQNLCLDTTDLIELLKSAVLKGHYRNSEWCQQTNSLILIVSCHLS